MNVIIEAMPKHLCLRIDDPPKKKLITWHSIRRIVAFKRDIYSRDLICMLLELSSDAVVELDESMVGWNAFLDALPLSIPGACNADEWLRRVSFPAFETTPVEIYCKH